MSDFATGWPLVPRTPRLLVGLSIANGGLMFATAITFAGGGYGAFRPHDTGGFRQIAGLLVVFASVGFVAFTVAALRRRSDLIAGLGVVVALANAVFVLSPFYLPRTLHILSILLSVIVVAVAATNHRPTVQGLPAWMILLGSSVGGVALIAAGRYEPGPSSSRALVVAEVAVSIVGLLMFAAGTIALAVDSSRVTSSNTMR